MTKRIILGIAFLFSLSLNSAFGQTAAQVKEKYGQPIEAFSVSERIWMTPEYTADGQVCQMRLYPKKISADTNYLSSTLDYWELKEVIDKIAPPEARGNRAKFPGFTNFMGQVYSVSFNYENVRFSFLASLHGRLEITPAAKLTPETAKTKNVVKSEREMTIPQNAEIATIRWTGRTCANK